MMNYLVCVKQVPDTTEIRIDPVTNTLIREGVPSILNTFDGFALETALRLKEQTGGTVTVITMGPPKAADVLRQALSTGADKVCLVTDRAFGGADTLVTSFTLSRTIQMLEERQGAPFDIVFCGKQAIDGDTAQVGPEIAEHMNRGQVTYATSVEIKDGKAIVHKDVDDGYQILAAPLPCVISVTKTSYELRIGSVSGRIAAARADIETINNDVLGLDPETIGLKGSPTQVKRSFTPELKKGGEILSGAAGSTLGEKLTGILWDEKLI